MNVPAAEVMDNPRGSGEFSSHGAVSSFREEMS